MYERVNKFLSDWMAVAWTVDYCSPLLPPFASSRADVDAQIAQKRQALLDELLAPKNN